MSTPREDFLQATKVVLEGMTGVRQWGGSYPQPPRVELLYMPPSLQHYTPYLALVEVGGSRVVIADHDGGADDDFRFDVYGQMSTYTTAPTISARTWAGRLRDDCRYTLENACDYPGALFGVSGCAWIRLDPDAVGYSEVEADFSLSCTVRLNYPLLVGT